MTNNSLLSRLAFSTGMLPDQLMTVIRTAPLRYKKYLIPKKNGGVRLVAQPAREVKSLQYFILSEIEDVLPVHDAAFAYRRGRSIRANAEGHRNSRYLLKMDFQKFFPSIKRSDVATHLERFCQNIYSSDEIGLVCNILLWVPERSAPLELCIGAPSSPAISNSLMFDFDQLIHETVASSGIRYTRYADDLTFSSMAKDKLSHVEDVVKNALRTMSYPSLKINSKKTVHCSKAARREVTGIVLTPENRLSVGRDRKRLARAMLHRANTTGLEREETEVLRGLLAFIDNVEPGFSDRLRRSLLKNREAN